MKKTIVGIMTIVAMLFAILGTNVNAATAEIDKKEVKAGERVTIKVTPNEPVKAVQYDIEFDSTSFKVVSGAKQDGNIAKVSQFALGTDETNQTLPATTVTFEALKDTKDAKFTIKNEGFSVDGSNKGTETITGDREFIINTDVAQPTETPEPTGTETPAPTGTETPAPTGTTKPSNDGKVKYPQTGAPVYAYVAGIALVVIVAGAVLAVRKNK